MTKKSMWELHPTIWKTQSSYMSWIRGGIRRGLWEKHPVKLEFLNSKVELVINENPRSKKRFPLVKRWKCVKCGGMFGSNETEVDHIVGGSSLKSMDDVQTFLKSVLEVDFKDLQVICKSCHKIKSNAEKKGITFSESKADKMAIEIMKTKKDKEWLLDRGVSPLSSQAKRRQQIYEILKGDIEI